MHYSAARCSMNQLQPVRCSLCNRHTVRASDSCSSKACVSVSTDLQQRHRHAGGWSEDATPCLMPPLTTTECSKTTRSASGGRRARAHLSALRLEGEDQACFNEHARGVAVAGVGGEVHADRSECGQW